MKTATKHEHAEQLALDIELPAAPVVPLRFRLNEATRRRNLRHVAELRDVLAARQADGTARRHRPAQPRRPDHPVRPAA